MKVAIADVRQEALDQAVEELVNYGIKREDILAIQADLTDREQYKAAADKVEEVFGGPPHLLIQTPASTPFGPIEASTLTISTGSWVFALTSVVNGLLIFVPHDSRRMRIRLNSRCYHFLHGCVYGPTTRP